MFFLNECSVNENQKHLRSIDSSKCKVRESVLPYPVDLRIDEFSLRVEASSGKCCVQSLIFKSVCFIFVSARPFPYALTKHK